MVVLVMLAAAVILIVHYRLAPRKCLVHAARARNFPKTRKPEYRVATPRMYLNADGGHFSRHKKFYGEALGSSMAEHGICDGAEFFGEYIPTSDTVEDRIEKLVPDSIVVVEAMAEASRTGKRLRKIKCVAGDGTISFYPDNKGKPHNKRSVSSVIAIVTHAARQSQRSFSPLGC